jgi:hypothetical protein
MLDELGVHGGCACIFHTFHFHTCIVSFHVNIVLGDWHFVWYMYFTLTVVLIMYSHISFVTLHANSA